MLKNHSVFKKFTLELQHEQNILNFRNLYVINGADFWEPLSPQEIDEID